MAGLGAAYAFDVTRHLRTRIVAARDHARGAWFWVLSAVTILAGVLVDDLFRIPIHGIHGRVDPATSSAFLTGIFLVAAIGPWLVRRARARRVAVELGRGEIRVEGAAVRPVDLVAVGIRAGVKGASVGLRSSKGAPFFLEVATLEEATAIAASLGGIRGTVIEDGPRGGAGARARLARTQKLVTAALCVTAPLYYLAVIHPRHVPLIEPKPLFGLLSVALAVITALVFAARRFVPGAHPSEIAGDTANRWDAHARLHAEEGAAPVARDEPSPLRRGEESPAAWFARLDALPIEAGGYRVQALPREDLVGILSDDEAALDTRMAAARVLRRRLGEPPKTLDVVTDPDIRLRVEAATLEPEEADDALDRLGPIFRAR